MNMNSIQVVQDTFLNGGGTYKLIETRDRFGYFEYEKVTDHTTGFYVSAPGGVENLPSLLLTAQNLDRVVWVRHRLSDLYVGLWQDPQGNVSIDETNWVPTLEQALYFGELWSQRAIFDIAEQREVLV